MRFTVTGRNSTWVRLYAPVAGCAMAPVANALSFASALAGNTSVYGSFRNENTLPLYLCNLSAPGFVAPDSVFGCTKSGLAAAGPAAHGLGN